MDYRFTGKTTVKDGHTLHEIEYLHQREYIAGGWIESKDNLSHTDKCIIHHDSYVYGNSHVEDNVIVKPGCTIIDSTIAGNMIIKKGAYIDNSILISRNFGVISEQTRIENKQFSFNHIIDNRITNDGYFCELNNFHIEILCSQHWCKVGCSTFTWEEVYDAAYLKNDLIHKLEQYEQANDFTKERILAWLQKSVNEQFQKIGKKIEED